MEDIINKKLARSTKIYYLCSMKRYTEEQLRDSVVNNNSIVQVIRDLGYKVSGGNVWRRIKKEIEDLKLDTTHFDKGVSKKSRYELDSILVSNSNYRNVGQLKLRLVSNNLLEYKCQICDNIGLWLDQPITLQLDHINGVRDDNRIENLRFLCPNCHSQTETFAGRNKT